MLNNSPVNLIPTIPHEIPRLIHKFQTTQVPWIVSNLWREGGIALVHSLEGQFKSIFVYQLGESIAKGEPFLRIWDVPKPRSVGIYQSEMSDLDTGERLAKMYPHGDFPVNLRLTDEEFKKEMASRTLAEQKFEHLGRWARDLKIDVLIIDTINSLLASCGNPNHESSASRFFDLLAQLPIKASLLVRHDGKPSGDNDMRQDNQRVRGSNRQVEDASLVIGLQRTGKAEHKVTVKVGKVRNATRPGDADVWFDAESCRLTPMPPVIALLEPGPLSREELIQRGSARFKLKARALDKEIADLRPYLIEGKEGHKRLWSINFNAQIPLNEDDEPTLTWFQLLRQGPQMDGVDMQPCISPSCISEAVQ